MRPSMEETMTDDGSVSPSPSPPTPPSPLPISVGPGNHRYEFSASPTPSPPFSAAPSSQSSAENLPLLQEPSARQAFSVDIKNQDEEADSSSSCLKDLLEWLLRKCCTCLQS
ncbi:uncharacterized protein LOC116200190 [Punica granatum]|uniref:Uncharacterized protein LOC116200190 n=2 Tax=Punica granatum TaxID=22663 RepID=A0A6P8CZH5_PUNGR|nr:uncharacterized protein LOC116200190 [Punica granatum]PKI38177.1 hypothetical protein CRG98_041430 [Punica granatum]